MLNIVIPTNNPGKCVRSMGSIIENTPKPFALTVIAADQKVTRNRNHGLKLSKSGWTCFLDDDIIVPPGWIERLLETANSQKNIGMVGCKIVQGGNIISTGTGENGYPICGDEPDFCQREFVEEVNGVAEACILIRTKLLKFDWLLSCHEGLDLSIRMRKHHYVTLYDGRVVVTHTGKLTKRNPLNFSHIWFHLKHPSTFPHAK